MLELKGIDKRFGRVHANDCVDLVVGAGELHGLLGENGAGKSTLMKILSGFVRPDAGEILLRGATLNLRTPADGLAAGVGLLHQDPLVLLPLTVLDNFLAGAPGGLLLDRRAGRRALADESRRLGFEFDPDELVRELSVGERQQLEIARLLWLGARVLILDEPTTAISDPQRDRLFDTLRTLAESGMSVIFVSHKLEEVQDLCSRVTVLREGAVVGTRDLPAPTDELVSLMFGRTVESGSRHNETLGSHSHLVIGGLRAREGNLEVADFSLTLRQGEVVGLAGLEGSGQRTVLRAIAGLQRSHSIRLELGGRELSRAPYRARRAAGVEYLPGERLDEGLIRGLTVEEHVVLTRQESRFFIDWNAAREVSEERIAAFNVKGRPESMPEALSGGNQQRTLLALLPDSLALLLMEHPTRGLDIESAEWVWSQLLARRAGGTAVIFASSDLEELRRYADRILVFFSGRVVAELDARAGQTENLGDLIAGVGAT